jgi:hypothetical protein
LDGGGRSLEVVVKVCHGGLWWLWVVMEVVEVVRVVRVVEGKLLWWLEWWRKFVRGGDGGG